MKASRLILLIMPALILASCGGGDPKKPENPSSTSAPITSSSSSGNQYVRHLTFDEIVDTFKSAEEGMKKITNVTQKDYALVASLNTSTGNLDKEEYNLDEVATLFSNSVIFSSYTASKADKSDEYKMFGKYSDTYGPQIERYVAFNDSFDKINTINVYRQIGEANKKNVVNTYDATVDEAENKFYLIDHNLDLIDPIVDKDKLITFAEDTKGYYEITWRRVEVTLTDVKTTDTYTKSFKFQNGQLFYEIVEHVKEVEKDSTIIQKQIGQLSAEFAYSSNGLFDRSKLPQAN